MSARNTQVTLSVDMKKHRIRIHRRTLAKLGAPKHIQLLVNPFTKTMAIQGLEKQTKFSHRVTPIEINPDYSYEIYSNSFIDELLSMVDGLDNKCTYRLTGEIQSNSNVAVFPLGSLQKTDDLEEQIWDNED